MKKVLLFVAIACMTLLVACIEIKKEAEVPASEMVSPNVGAIQQGDTIVGILSANAYVKGYKKAAAVTVVYYLYQDGTVRHTTIKDEPISLPMTDAEAKAFILAKKNGATVISF